ncbi:MAG: AcrB/AcrD/AcrF family protein [Planctomycetota bacterium]|nr:MAG: AcrB/AcrD/AcrF family protein [Planctomycetota bacterium]
MSLTRFALQNKSIVLAATALLVGYGIFAFQTMPRREDPEFTIRGTRIETRWPGAPAEQVEELVSVPIEEAVRGLDEVSQVTSTSRTGLSIVAVELDDAITDVDQVWNDVRAEVDRIRNQLPDGVQDPLVNTRFGDTAALLLAIVQTPLPGASSIEHPYSPRELELIADRLKDELYLVEGVATVSLYGVQREALFLEVEPGRWSGLQLTLDQLRDRINARNIVAPGGAIDTERGRFSVKPSGDLGALDELQRIIIGADDGGHPVYLNDLEIQVKRAYADPPSQLFRQTNASGFSSECVLISVTMKSGFKITDLGVAAKQVIARSQRTLLPPDVDVVLVSDQPLMVDQKISDFLLNLGQAVLIVVLVAFLMIGIRIALVMASAIPIVVVISIGLSSWFGVQLEQISIASLIIALGLLVDCAIEVGDNIHRFLAMGKSRKEATLEGVKEIAFPVLIATLTTVAAFLPMVTIPGGSGEFLYSLPVVVSITLLVSWLTGMTTTALLGYVIMRAPKGGGHGVSPFVWILRGLTLGRFPKPQDSPSGGTYRAVAGFCLRFKWIPLVLAVAAFLFAVSRPIGSQFFPPNYRNQFTIDLHLPEGTPIQKTSRVTAELEKIVVEEGRRSAARAAESAAAGEASETHLVSMTTFVGGGSPRWYLSLNPPDPVANVAHAVVNVAKAEHVDDLVASIQRRAERELAGVRVAVQKLMNGPAVDAPIGLRIFGEEAGQLRKLSASLQQILSQTPGTWDVHDTWGNLGYQIDVEIDEERALLAGVTHASVAKSLNAYYSGHHLTTYREGDHQIPVYLRVPPASRRSIEPLQDVFVEGNQGKVPLDAVATVEAKHQPVKIVRRDGARMIEVRARNRPGSLANEILAQAQPKIDALVKQFPAGYRLEVGGEMEETKEGQAKIMAAFMISIFLIIFLLVVQYNSVIKPFFVILTLPMAATGAFLGLWIMDAPASFFANLGLLSLAGVVLNDAIVLIEFVENLIAEKLRKQEDLAAPGQPHACGLTIPAFRNCVVEGARMRILPISLTSLTTIGGLIPLALSGGPMWEPLCYVLIFGLALATFMTLFVLPTIYAIFVEWFRVRTVRLEEA